MIKDWLMKKALGFGAKDLTEEEKEAIVTVFNKNPELFKKIQKDLEEGKKSGKPEMYVAKDVMTKHAQELQKLLMEVPPNVAGKIMSLATKFGGM